VLPGHRVGTCLRLCQPQIRAPGVMRSPSQASAHYSGLCVCGSVFACPVCASKVSERRRVELCSGITAWRAQGGCVLMAVYTFSHGPKLALRDGLELFLRAQRDMKHGKSWMGFRASYGIVGAVKALEVTYGELNGWHPHTHELLFLREAPPDLELFTAQLYGRWRVAAERKGLSMSELRGLKVEATYGAIGDYVAKWGREPAKRPWGPEDELVKANSKRAGRLYGVDRFTPFDLLRLVAETGESWAADRFREFVGGMYRRKQLVWSRGLRELLGLGLEATDEELATRFEEDAYLLRQLTEREWVAIVGLEQRAQVLTYARTGDLALLRRLLDPLVEKWESSAAAARQRQVRAS
jgi:hypothetical protein